MNLPLRLPALVLVLAVSSAAFAGNPSNPILFVTQVPMPEEVNSRNVTESYQSCVSPFSNHLGDTAAMASRNSVALAAPAHRSGVHAAAGWAAAVVALAARCRSTSRATSHELLRHAARLLTAGAGAASGCDRSDPCGTTAALFDLLR